MLATQTAETGPDAKDVKQWIKAKIAQTIKALQKRYVTSDSAVTSEDAEANLLCCALEAVFVHGIKAKHRGARKGGGGGRSGGRGGGALPQPDFWELLKTVTHRNVILELEKLSFINSGVGRCRAWVRLALNDGLLECYLASLLREDSKLAGYYQQGALLLDAEEREVLLSLLQGLASLSFQLSYKSAVLNEWTVTPLALAGLCPPPAADSVLPSSGHRPPKHPHHLNHNHHHHDTNGKRKESWDTVSQSSSGGSDVAIGGVGGVEAGAEMRSSNQSLDTTGSSQLSSSLSSDSLLQGSEPRLPDSSRESWDIGGHATDSKKAFREESTTSSQDSMREDSYVSSLAGDQLSENTAFSSLDNDPPHTPAHDANHPSSSPSHTHITRDADQHSPSLTHTHTPPDTQTTPVTDVTHTSSSSPPTSHTHTQDTEARVPSPTHPSSDTHVPAAVTADTHSLAHAPNTNYLCTSTVADEDDFYNSYTTYHHEHATHTTAEGAAPVAQHTPTRDTHTSASVPLTSTPSAIPAAATGGEDKEVTSAVDAYFTHIHTTTRTTHAQGTHTHANTNTHTQGTLNAHTQTRGSATPDLQRELPQQQQQEKESSVALDPEDTVVEVLRQNRREKSPMRQRNRGTEHTPSSNGTSTQHGITKTATPGTKEDGTPNATATTPDPAKDTEAGDKPGPLTTSGYPRRTASIVSRRLSTDSQHPTSWISEDDFYKPGVSEDSVSNGPSFLEAPPAQVNGTTLLHTAPEPPQTPSVVHRRQMGLSNPFRGLLKLGTLCKRGAVGIWWEVHCELSPFELRLYEDPEERAASDTCSLLRCEEARLHGDAADSANGRFLLAFAGGKRLHLRAGSRGEAEDWVERVQEAVAQIRPRAGPRNTAASGNSGAVTPDDDWVEIHVSEGFQSSSTTTPSSATTPTSIPGSPDHTPNGNDPATQAPPPPPPLEELDWTRPAGPEPDAIKETVVYQLASPHHQHQHLLQQQQQRGPSLPPGAQLEEPSLGWTPLLLSLSLEALRGFRWQASSSASDLAQEEEEEDGGGAGRKVPLFCHAIQTIRDVVPDAARGGPEFFRVVNSSGAVLTLRAESGDEARVWRMLIRGALDAYLDTEEDEVEEATAAGAEGVGGGAGLAPGSAQRLVQHRLKGELAALLPHLCTVPTERGLDTQGFRCAGCNKQIGFSMGKARRCEFSAQYYCDSCHRGDAIVIPSRMVHNWDLTPREVCRQVLKLLGQIESEPLVNLDLLNPDLYGHTETMGTMRLLRQKLRLLGDYVLLCRSGIKAKLQSKLHQRGYLLESDQLYSVLDLRQIAEGQYYFFLLSLVQLGASHVHACSLCTQRGFICQICNADDIIFPFQFETTSRCKDCKAVFHTSCRAESVACPRCVRLQRYLERDML
ncbi:pleckstrin homology domain-containing family M member 1 [Engraulis encrasicolus]|uniref:pleckstrin homology domain-containing family M member 1 n=1 Tax=Engraulis encrasicolus TaxID=184585 RepID=UPI002FD46F4F